MERLWALMEELQMDLLLVTEPGKLDETVIARERNRALERGCDILVVPRKMGALGGKVNSEPDARNVYFFF
jgi:hypothetical protein